MSFAKYCVIYKEFTPTIVLNGSSNLNCTYNTSLRSFPHFWDLQIKSQPYIQDFLEKLSSFLGSTNRIPTVHTRLSWKAFLIFGIQLQIKSQLYIQDFLEKISSSLRSIYKSDLNHTGMTSFRIFHQPWSSLLKSLSCISQTGRFTKPLLKSLSCISQKHCWNHFHVFHKKKNQCWNHFHVFHKTIVEITFMYFTMLIWNHFHVFQKTNVEITFMYFTKPLLKSLSCISQC
jgi:hypothetical protein